MTGGKSCCCDDISFRQPHSQAFPPSSFDRLHFVFAYCKQSKLDGRNLSLGTRLSFRYTIPRLSHPQLSSLFIPQAMKVESPRAQEQGKLQCSINGHHQTLTALSYMHSLQFCMKAFIQHTSFCTVSSSPTLAALSSSRWHCEVVPGNTWQRNLSRTRIHRFKIDLLLFGSVFS